MKKWMVKASFVIQADTRSKAWELSRLLASEKMRDLLTIESISTEPLLDAEEWIAINEPIQARG